MTEANEAGEETRPGQQRAPERPIIEPPRLRDPGERERRTTWLELFFDLIFAVAIDQVAERLTGGITWRSVGGYVVLLVPIWWAWTGYAYYNNRFGTDDLSDRLLTLLQMAAATVLAVRAHDALMGGAAMFAIAYGAFRFILALRYAEAAWRVPEARALATREAVGFGLAATAWLVSAWVPSPARFWLWALGFLIDIGTPLTLGKLNAKFPLNAAHLQERFGNFTLILLGEGAINTVNALREIEWSWQPALIGAESLTTAFALWWVYFETLDGRPITTAGKPGQMHLHLSWVFSHLALAAGIAAMAVSAALAIPMASAARFSDKPRWLFTGAVALAFGALAVITYSYAQAGSWQSDRIRAVSHLLVMVVALALAAFGGAMSAPWAIGVVALASVAQVAIDLTRNRDARAA